MKHRSLRTPFALAAFAVLGSAVSGSSCASAPSNPNLGTGTFKVVVTSVNGGPLPSGSNPLPPNLGVTAEDWAFTVEAHTPTGELASDFNGMVRLTVVPGTVVTVNGSNSRNILMQGGRGQGSITATGVYGPAQLWVEDLGYVPAPPDRVPPPQCADGLDNNNNGLIDYPADPGCYYADDDTEDGGTYTMGVSAPVNYRLPKISDVRGTSRTPFPNEAVNIQAAAPENLVVTRVSGNGFFVTDITPDQVKHGYNSLFAYNFSTPANLQICDRIIQLSGTSNDFYGFTQLSFPSFLNTYNVLGQDGGVFDPLQGIPGCTVPEPTVLDPANAMIFSGDKNTTAAALYPLEAGLVRLEGFTIAPNFGPALAVDNVFMPGQSNCDFNGNGQIDYGFLAADNNCPAGRCEGDCANRCDTSPDCSEYTAFSARSQYKVAHGTCKGGASGSAPACMGMQRVGPLCTATPVCTWANNACTGDPSCTGKTSEAACLAILCAWTPPGTATMILINTSTVSTFDPHAQAGQTIPMISGSLTEFSGGSLNWTVEARCTDDLVCPASMGCSTQVPVPSYKACVQARTIDDNDQGTN